MTTVLVCGGRDYRDYNHVYDVLDEIHRQRLIECVVDGMAAGADTLAHSWAKDNKVYSRRFRPDWKKHGRSAGIVRNIEMLNESDPDLVVAFPGGRGTAHMVSIAKDAGKRVIEVEPRHEQPVSK